MPDSMPPSGKTKSLKESNDDVEPVPQTSTVDGITDQVEELKTVLDSRHVLMLDAIAEKPSELAPKRGRQGPKSFAPASDKTGARRLEEEKLVQSRADWVELASQPLVQSVRALSTGVWDAKEEIVELTTMRGSHFVTVGRYSATRKATVLEPEEALFLMEKGALEVFDDGVPMTIQRATHKLHPKNMSASEVAVYLYLRRIGYIVKRSTSTLPTRGRDTSLSADTSKKSTEACSSSNTGTSDATPTPTSTKSWPRLSGIFARISARMKKAVAPIIERMSFLPPGLWVPLEEDPDVEPIVSTRLPENLGEVYEKLRAQSLNASLINLNPSIRNTKLRLAFDVFKCDGKFKKSAPGEPHYRICVIESTDEVPSLADIQLVTLAAKDAEVKFAVVDSGTISFYDILDLQIPIFCDWEAIEPLHSTHSSSKQRKRHRENDDGQNNKTKAHRMA